MLCNGALCYEVFVCHVVVKGANASQLVVAPNTCYVLAHKDFLCSVLYVYRYSFCTYVRMYLGIVRIPKYISTCNNSVSIHCTLMLITQYYTLCIYMCTYALCVYVHTCINVMLM